MRSVGDQLHAKHTSARCTAGHKEVTGPVRGCLAWSERSGWVPAARAHQIKGRGESSNHSSPTFSCPPTHHALGAQATAPPLNTQERQWQQRRWHRQGCLHQPAPDMQA